MPDVRRSFTIAGVAVIAGALLAVCAALAAPTLTGTVSDGQGQTWSVTLTPATQPTTKPATQPSTKPTTQPTTKPVAGYVGLTPGKHYNVDRAYEVVGGKLTIETVGNGPPAVLNVASRQLVRALVGDATLRNVKVNIADDGIVVEQGKPEAPGGNVTCENVWQSTGSLVWSYGGKSVRVKHCEQAAPGKKYWIYNGDNELAVLEIDGYGAAPIRQGKYEAALRIMHTASAEIRGCTFVGSGYKQCVQTRGGSFQGKATHVYTDCTFTGGIDVGWMKVAGEPMNPCPLALCRFVNCTVDQVYPRPGIGRIEFVNTKYNGKPTTAGKDYRW